MRVAVIGTGYVGLVTGTCFSDMGNDVWCVDVDEAKIERLKQGIIPIYEPGLSDMVLKNYKAGSLRFTTKIEEALENAAGEDEIAAPARPGNIDPLTGQFTLFEE